MKRKLEQLNLLDDFLFGSVLSYPEIGEAFCRRILKILLNVDMDRLHVVPQKVYYGSDTDQRGTRLDVYIEETGGAGTVYDVEPEKMEDSCGDNADSVLLEDIHKMVETVRYDKEVSLEYMKVYERERMIESRGEAKGKIKGEILGEMKFIRNMSKSMKPDKISESSGLDQEYIEKILAYIWKYPEETDEAVADRILAAGKKEE